MSLSPSFSFRYLSIAAVLLCSFISLPTANASTLKLGVGLKGGLVGAAAQGVDDHSSITDQDGRGYQVERPEFYPAFGLGGGAGLSLDLRVLDIIAIETGFIYTSMTTSGWNDKVHASSGQKIARVTQNQSTQAYQIPLLVRANVPLSLVRPYLGVGFEFILQNESSLSYDVDNKQGSVDMTPIENRNQIEPTNYTLFLVTLGMELKFAEFRIPIEIRAGYTLGFDPELDARATYDRDQNQIIYDGVQQGHFGVFTGLIYDFDLF